MSSLKIFAIILTMLSTAAVASEVKVYELKGGITVSIEEAPFNPKNHTLENCEDPTTPCKIDGLFPYGTAFDLPKTYLKEMSLMIGGEKYSLDVTGMYDAWGNRPLEYEGSVRYLGAHCYDKHYCTLRGLFSDAAGSFVAEWKVINGESIRTILTSSDDVVNLFIENIDPPYYE